LAANTCLEFETPSILPSNKDTSLFTSPTVTSLKVVLDLSD
jgi:hypothetical protein